MSLSPPSFSPCPQAAFGFAELADEVWVMTLVATLPTSRAALPSQPSSPSAFGRHAKGMLPGNLPVGAGHWWHWAVPGAAGCRWPWASFTHHGQLARSVMWRSSTWAKSLVEDSLHPILPNVNVVQLLPPLLQPLEPKAWVPK